MQNMDYVANLRLDQAWGGAQIMGAAHQVNALYYGATTGTGNPGDQWGFVVGAGLKINAPFITQGDYFQTQVNYTQGATKYLNNGNDTNYAIENGAGTTVGVMSDCVFGGSVAGVATTGCNLTTGWDVSASYEHFWTPSVHQSLFGSYMAIDYNAQANAQLCSIAGFSGGTFGAGAVAGAGCNNNWNYFEVGSRLQWDVTKSFYLGVEALYTQVNGATTGAAGAGGYSFTGANVATGPQFNQARASDWVFTVRAHRDFLP
jgi:Porin subfamily